MSEKKSITNVELRAAYDEAVKTGQNIHQLAATLGCLAGSLGVRLCKIKKDLKEKKGMTEEQISMIFPDLKRKSGSGRKGERDSFLDELAREVASRTADTLPEEVPSVE